MKLFAWWYGVVKIGFHQNWSIIFLWAWFLLLASDGGNKLGSLLWKFKTSAALDWFKQNKFEISMLKTIWFTMKLIVSWMVLQEIEFVINQSNACRKCVLINFDKKIQILFKHYWNHTWNCWHKLSTEIIINVLRKIQINVKLCWWWCIDVVVTVLFFQLILLWLAGNFSVNFD